MSTSAQVVLNDKWCQKRGVVDGITWTGAAAPFSIMLFQMGKTSFGERFFIAGQVNHEAVRTVPCHIPLTFRINRMKSWVGVCREEINWYISFTTEGQELFSPGGYSGSG